MYEYAITVIGHDRPGIIADVSAVLADLGLNLTDSSMTLLRGHFAMTLICAGEPSAAVVEAALAFSADPTAPPILSGPGTLVVTVREVGAEAAASAVGGHYV